MRYLRTVSPVVMAIVCGYSLNDLARAIDHHAGIHSATDLAPWIIVPVTGITAAYGAWRAYRDAKPPQAPS